MLVVLCASGTRLAPPEVERRPCWNCLAAEWFVGFSWGQKTFWYQHHFIYAIQNAEHRNARCFFDHNGDRYDSWECLQAVCAWMKSIAIQIFGGIFEWSICNKEISSSEAAIYREKASSKRQKKKKKMHLRSWKYLQSGDRSKRGCICAAESISKVATEAKEDAST